MHMEVPVPQFNTLHQMFEVQYTEPAAAIDKIAERAATIAALPVVFPTQSHEIR
jgi:DNA-binding ferritin-like protein